jgi:hypothetical protein
MLRSYRRNLPILLTAKPPISDMLEVAIPPAPKQAAGCTMQSVPYGPGTHCQYSYVPDYNTLTTYILYFTYTKSTYLTYNKTTYFYLYKN